MYGYKVQTSFQPKGHEASGSTVHEDRDAFDVRPIDPPIDGTRSAPNRDKPLAEIRVSRNEMEALYRYWFKRYRDEVEFCYIHDYCGDMKERYFTSKRMGELEDHVSREFLDELAKEVETRNAAIEPHRENFLLSEDVRGRLLDEVERTAADNSDLQRIDDRFTQKFLGVLDGFTEEQRSDLHEKVGLTTQCSFSSRLPRQRKDGRICQSPHRRHGS